MSVELKDGIIIHHGLQMKLWDSKKKLTPHHLGTFLIIIDYALQIKNNLSKGYLYHTCKLEKTMELLFNNSKSIIPLKLNNPYDVHETPEILEMNKELRYYQNDAIKKLDERWDGVKSLFLPCGTGKTLIFAHHLKNNNYKNIFIVSPLKIHVKQTLDRIKHFIPNYKNLLLDSDLTTDFEDVKNILNNNCLISTTYDSCENVLIKLFNEDLESKYDLSNSIIIIDEAHNLCNKQKLIKIIKSFPKVLLVTATPPIQLEEIMESSVIYKYTMKDALKDKFICDYQIYLPVIELKNDISTTDINIPDEILNLDNNLCKKGLFLINGMMMNGARKCIVFMSTVEECISFKEIVIKIMEDYHSLPLWVDIITSNVNYLKRAELINNFKKHEDRLDTIKLLLSIRILNENIDIPECDSVFLSNISENNNDISILQKICRSNRLDKNNPNKISHCFIYCDEWSKSLNCLKLLKDSDIEFSKKIKIIGSNYDNIININEKEKIIINNKNFNAYINVKCISLQDIWNDNKNLLFKFCEENKRCPTRRKKYETKIGRWLSSQKSKLNNITNEIYIELSVNEYVKKSLDKYLLEKNKDKDKLTHDEMKNLLFEFCDENKKCPTKREQNINKSVYKWLSAQKSKLNNITDEIYIELSENEYVKKSLDKYLLDKDKLNQSDMKNLLFEFCNENKKCPSYRDTYKYKNVGVFLQNKKTKLNNITDEIYIELSENEYVKKSLDKYLNNKLTEIDMETDMKTLLFKFCNENKKCPTYKEKYINKNVGMFLQNKKTKLNNITDKIYIELSENEYVKKSLDKYLNNSIKNKTSHII